VRPYPQGQPDVGIVQIVGGADAHVVHALLGRSPAQLLQLPVEPLDLREVLHVQRVLVEDADRIVRVRRRHQPAPHRADGLQVPGCDVAGHSDDGEVRGHEGDCTWGLRPQRGVAGVRAQWLAWVSTHPFTPSSSPHRTRTIDGDHVPGGTCGAPIDLEPRTPGVVLPAALGGVAGPVSIGLGEVLSSPDVGHLHVPHARARAPVVRIASSTSLEPETKTTCSEA